MIEKNSEKGYSLVEIAIVISLGAIVVTMVTFAVFTFRNTIQYDILLNQIVESVNFSKNRALSGRLNDEGSRVGYGVKFFNDTYVEFVGDQYEESDTRNVVNNVPFGLHLDCSCSIDVNDEIVFSAVEGMSNNICTVNIYRSESDDPVGVVVIGRYGIEQAN
ncbi:MAG: prepilin-type N-terminal cleavage/methylation domain-containing protein [Candidatus Dojkabacteria bacterium]|jgi:hypothetical protein|nr:prepilin-type N-terminal cleavage/methylation domain-containing protein [Candidatus Dojkabacteria bacterium]